MNRTGQRELLLTMFQRAKGAEVPLTAILQLRISQFGARIFELRREGYVIKNRTEHINGAVHSWYRLESSPDELAGESLRANTRQIKRADPKEEPAPTGTFPAFGSLAPESYGVD
jgi:helix-turn-helix protein